MLRSNDLHFHSKANKFCTYNRVSRTKPSQFPTCALLGALTDMVTTHLAEENHTMVNSAKTTNTISDLSNLPTFMNLQIQYLAKLEDAMLITQNCYASVQCKVCNGNSEEKVQQLERHKKGCVSLVRLATEHLTVYFMEVTSIAKV